MLFTLLSLIIKVEEGFYFAKKGRKESGIGVFFHWKKIEKEDGTATFSEWR